MSVDWITVLGFSAAAFSTTSFVPQAWRVIRKRDTSSISAATYGMTTFGFALWLSYGIAKGEWPLILTNTICLALAAFILVMKLLPQQQKEAVAETLDSGGGRT
jgi:MtN3 and saliva related transmembrane protein